MILRDDAELYQGVPSKVKLANPDAGTVAFVHYDQRRPGLLTLDHYLDAVLTGLDQRDGAGSERRDGTGELGFERLRVRPVVEGHVAEAKAVVRQPQREVTHGG